MNGDLFFRSEETAVRAGRGIRDLKLIRVLHPLGEIIDRDPYVHGKGIRDVERRFPDLGAVRIAAVLNKQIFLRILFQDVRDIRLNLFCLQICHRPVINVFHHGDRERSEIIGIGAFQPDLSVLHVRGTELEGLVCGIRVLETASGNAVGRYDMDGFPVAFPCHIENEKVLLQMLADRFNGKICLDVLIFGLERHATVAQDLRGRNALRVLPGILVMLHDCLVCVFVQIILIHAQHIEHGCHSIGFVIRSVLVIYLSDSSCPPDSEIIPETVFPVNGSVRVSRVDP